MGHEFVIKDLGSLHYFLEVEVNCFSNGNFLNQAKYSSELIERSQIKDCRPTITPLVSKIRRPSDDDPAFHDPQHYGSIVGGL